MISALRYLGKKEWMYFSLSTVFILIQVYLNLKLPDYMNNVTKMVNLPGSTMSDIYQEGAKMLACALLGAACSLVISFFASQVAAGLAKTLRAKVFHQVTQFSTEEMNQFSSDSLITRTTNDINQIQMILAMGLVVIIQAPVTAIWAIAKIQSQSWQWTAMTVGSVALLFLTIAILVIFAMPRYLKIQSMIDHLNTVTRENLSGIRVVRAYNAEEYEAQKFEKANQDIAETNIFVGKFMPLMPATMNLIRNGLTLGIYWVGAYLINEVSMTNLTSPLVMKDHLMQRMDIFGNMVVFVSYAIQVVMSFVMLTMIFVNMPRAQVSAKRVLEVINTKPNLVDGDKTMADVHEQGTVEFSHVTFKYPDAKDAVIEDVSFTAKRGETVAFIGSTGSGKSTLVNLIPRFYDATAGQVKVDGLDVKQYQQKVLHDIVGYIPQKAFLFRGTIEDNMHYGDSGHDLTTEDMEKALTIAQADEFIQKLPEGIQTDIAQGGSNVSGGQRQRLAIARTLARKPEILIFDDSFSALDYKTDRILRKALDDQLAQTTKLIVAQRIGTIREADKIIVLDKGQVAGMGTHAELMQTCEVYQDIAYSQLSKEELENA